VRTITEAAHRGGELVDDLLAFSRLGRAELKKTRVALGPLVEEVKRELGPEWEGRRVEWRVGPLPVVQGDANLLRAALKNLLANALKYSRTRPDAIIEISAREHDAEVEVTVKDNGVGFDMRYADKLFGVFQRLHTSDQFEGTGIGLANVRRIVLRHGGRVWAEGAVGQGAAFHFTLPGPAAAEAPA
jgi:light-regulated signal transduction histidine kinase (bacteriophytochrome)